MTNPRKAFEKALSKVSSDRDINWSQLARWAREMEKEVKELGGPVDTEKGLRLLSDIADSCTMALKAIGWRNTNITSKVVDDLYRASESPWDYEWHSGSGDRALRDLAKAVNNFSRAVQKKDAMDMFEYFADVAIEVQNMATSYGARGGDLDELSADLYDTHAELWEQREKGKTAMTNPRKAFEEALEKTAVNTADIIVLDDDDLEQLELRDPKLARQWKGYYFKMTYETWDEEAIEAGDTDDRGWLIRKSEKFDTLEELLDDSDVSYKSWIEWSSSHPNPAHDWLISEDEQDYSSGERTQYSLWIERGDRAKLSREEMEFINKQLRV